jgi:hypothetical protein
MSAQDHIGKATAAVERTIQGSDNTPPAEDLTTLLRKEASSRSPEAVASSVPGDPWGIDVGLGYLLMQAADKIEQRGDLLRRVLAGWNGSNIIDADLYREIEEAVGR